MPTKTADAYHRRQARVASTTPELPVRVMIDRAKLYADDRLWLDPVELKTTIRRLAEIAEGSVTIAQTSKPEKPVAPASNPRPEPVAPPAATHVGLVLGLKGREDYEARLYKIDEDLMGDHYGRRFDTKDYGYDADDAFRLDLASVRPL